MPRAGKLLNDYLKLHRLDYSKRIEQLFNAAGCPDDVTELYASLDDPECRVQIEETMRNRGERESYYIMRYGMRTNGHIVVFFDGTKEDIVSRLEMAVIMKRGG